MQTLYILFYLGLLFEFGICYREGEWFPKLGQPEPRRQIVIIVGFG